MVDDVTHVLDTCMPVEERLSLASALGCALVARPTEPSGVIEWDLLPLVAVEERDNASWQT